MIAQRNPPAVWSGVFFARVDQPAAGAGDLIGQREDHHFTKGQASKHGAKKVIEGNLAEERHSGGSNSALTGLSQPIGAEP